MKDTQNKDNYPVLESNTYRGIYYSVINDCDENTGGYYIEFYKDPGENGDINYDNRLDYMVIHIDNKDEMRNSKKYVENHIDSLLLEINQSNTYDLEEEKI